MIRLADRENVAVPTTRQGRRGEQIAGGYVHEVEPGLRSWVAVLDFKSMYPSIMISNNICSTTLVDSAFHKNLEDVWFLRYRNKIQISEEQARTCSKVAFDLVAVRSLQAEARKARSEGNEQPHSKQKATIRSQDTHELILRRLCKRILPLTHKDIGASITEWAKHNIRPIISDLGKDG